jgi:hypothetical protein
VLQGLLLNAADKAAEKKERPKDLSSMSVEEMVKSGMSIEDLLS